MFKRLSILFIIPLLSGCYDTELLFENQYKAVVEAYLYVDKEIKNINLSSMISFGDDSTGGEKITDAIILLGRDQVIWTLIHDNSAPGNYYLEETLLMVPGDTFTLAVERNDEVLTAKTIIPDDPPAVTMSATAISIPKVESMRDFRNITMPDPVELNWDNPEAKYYFLNIQNIESNPTPIMPDPPEHSPFARGGFAFQMVSRPTNDNFYSILPQTLTHYGTHRIIMTSVNDEYVNLYNSMNQDSRELNEPYTNIENGLGIFTAFNSDTLYLQVIPVYL